MYENCNPVPARNAGRCNIFSRLGFKAVRRWQADAPVIQRWIDGKPPLRDEVVSEPVSVTRPRGQTVGELIALAMANGGRSRRYN
ncbi:MAG: hypothetical protein WC734_00555 [Patescibacteria group bacterium]